MKDIIEVGGVKIEVDLSEARQIQSFKVGDRIKLLKKEYNDKFRSMPGVIVGFDAFKERPTIVVCYLDQTYSSASVCFAYINKDSEDVEITPMLSEEWKLDKADAVAALDTDILKKRAEVEELERKKSYFIEQFGRHLE